MLLVTNAICAEVEILITASVIDVNAAITEHCKSPRATPLLVSKIQYYTTGVITLSSTVYQLSRLLVYHKSNCVMFQNLFQAVRLMVTDALENRL